jgi:2-iminobutanoate/2-iminopropanoate deaminase
MQCKFGTCEQTSCSDVTLKEGVDMDRSVVSTTAAASPRAFYSQGVGAKGLLFTAGCVGVDPVTEQIPEGFEEQVQAAIANVKAILEAGGASLDAVVKTTCFVTRQEDFSRLDSIYRTFFTGHPPARTTVVCQLVRPEFLFEIEAVAVL